MPRPDPSVGVARASRRRRARRAPAGRPRRRGLTLVELIIAAGIIGLLSVAATFFWVDSFAFVRLASADNAALADARAVLNRLAREIREVKYDTGNGAYCVSTLTATQMVFNRTSGGYVSTCGGASPGAATGDIAVTVQVPAGTTSLNLGYAGTLASPATTKALSGQASAFGLRYLDAAFAATTSTSALRFVEVTLTVQPSGAPATQVRTVVALRNS